MTVNWGAIRDDLALASPLFALAAAACWVGSARLLVNALAVMRRCSRERRVVELIKDEIWRRLDGSDTPGP